MMRWEWQAGDPEKYWQGWHWDGKPGAEYDTFLCLQSFRFNIDPFIQKIERQRTGALRYHFYNIVNSLINISVVLVLHFSYV